MPALRLVLLNCSALDESHPAARQRELCRAEWWQLQTAVGQLKDRGLVPDTILSSTAAAALETAAILLKALKLPSNRVQMSGQLAGADSAPLLAMLAGLPKDTRTCLVCAHEPMLGTLLAQLSAYSAPAGLPVGGIAGLRYDAGACWQQLATVPAELELLYMPAPAC